MIKAHLGPWTLESDQDGDNLSLTYDEPACPPTDDDADDGAEAVFVKIAIVEDPELDELHKVIVAWRKMRAV